MSFPKLVFFLDDRDCFLKDQLLIRHTVIFIAAQCIGQ